MNADKPIAVDPPADLPALTKKELRIWELYTQCRDEWSEMDLRILHAGVKRETELQKVRREANRTPYTCLGSNGSVMIHPIHRMVTYIENQWRGLIRDLALNVSPKEAQGVNRTRRPRRAADELSGGQAASKELTPQERRKKAMSLVH